jgi:large subunit ribosomal protein L20
MARVKRGVTAHARHKKVLKAAEGYYGRRKSSITVAKAAVDKAGQIGRAHGRTKVTSLHGVWRQRI